MQLRDYPIRNKRGLVEIPGNVTITVRERGKIVPQHCRHEHNIWVDLGREYLARVIAPNSTLTDHYGENPPTNPREFIQYMGVGIGGDSQNNPSAYQAPLKDDYPPASTGGAPGDWGNKQADDDLTIQYLERPVKLNVGSPTWLGEVQTPVTFLNSSRTLRVDRLFNTSEVNLVGPYTIVPLSEVALFLSTQDPDAANVYDTGNPPSMKGTGRQVLVAYNTFAPISKTTSFSLEVQWELRM